jgi:hypothetical protein
MFTTHYSYTFEAYPFEKHNNGYLNLSKETKFPCGTGSSDTSQGSYCKQTRWRLSEFIVDQTLIRDGSNYVWLWVAIEPTNRTILVIRTSNERNMLVAERFLSNVIKEYGEHPVSTDGGTWYSQASVLETKSSSHPFFI